MEISWTKRIHYEGDDLKNADDFITGYMVGADIKFWFFLCLAGAAFGLGLALGIVIQ